MSQTVEPSISCSPFVRSSCAASSTLRARVTESKCIALRSLYVGRARAQLASACMFAAGSLFRRRLCTTALNRTQDQRELLAF